MAAGSPPDASVHDKLGELDAHAGRFVEAAAHFREAAKLRPGDPSLLFRWARATFDAGSPADARAILDRAAQIAPGHPAILRLQAEICERTGD